MSGVLTIDGDEKDLIASEGQSDKSAVLNALFNAMEDAWTPWVPTWTNLTVGNGVVVARYRQIGKLVICRLSLIFGTTTGSISGLIGFSLPVTRVAYPGTAGACGIGRAQAIDVSDSNKIYPCDVVNTSTTVGSILVCLTGGTYAVDTSTSSTIPFTWTTSDEIHAQICYEAA